MGRQTGSLNRRDARGLREQSRLREQSGLRETQSVFGRALSPPREQVPHANETCTRETAPETSLSLSEMGVGRGPSVHSPRKPTPWTNRTEANPRPDGRPRVVLSR